MATAWKYSEILSPNTQFQRAINLSLDLGKTEFIKSYIPTQSSSAVLAKYLRNALTPGDDRASILIGPYGKGKSHTIFMALSLLSDYSEETTELVTHLIEKLEEIDPETAQLVKQVRGEHKRLLPIIINDRYLDIRQAFLASLKNALQQAGLNDLMPNNYYQQCLLTIKRWANQYPDTYQAYLRYLQAADIQCTDFENKLKQYDAEALNIFRMCHKAILSGAEFDPLLKSDVPTLYSQVSDALAKAGTYDGIFIVFDEFGKYLETSVSYREQPRFEVLQNLAEMCGRVQSSCMMMTCISHKAISEYANRLSASQQSSFRTVEGRFTPIYFTSTFEGSFSLISGALERDRTRYNEFINSHRESFEQTMQECTELGCFSGYQSSVEEIVRQCIPMHPLTTLALMKLSERVAQNERTLFTFLADQSSPLAEFIRKHDGRYILAPVDLVYDYFHISIRETSYDQDLKDLVIYADSLMSILPQDQACLIRAIVLFSMLSDSCLMAVKPVLKAALQWPVERVEQAISALEQAHRIYTRRSDGVLCLMRSATESVRQDIDYEVKLRSGRINIADQLAEIKDPGFTIPRRYNDQHEIVRFFQNIFISEEVFLRERSSAFLTKSCTADGYVVYLLGNASPEEVQNKLLEWNDARIVVLLPQIPFTFRGAVEECAAIKKLLSNATDEVTTEELSYYLDDMLQVVNRGFADLFEGQAQCISLSGVTSCKSIGKEISVLCETALYPDTPLICHEMINRNVISGQMKQARCKVIDTVLASDKFMEAYELKTAEGAIMKAILGHLQDSRMEKVLSVIQGFLKNCEKGRKPISQLYQTLTASPYGMRKGVLPILFAYCIREYQQTATIYNRQKEVPINGETLGAFDEHVADYELLIDCGSTDQVEYIAALCKEYTPGDNTPNIRAIHDALCRFIRALPRSARANQKRLDLNQEIQPILSSIISVRRELVRFDTNPRDVVIEKLPKALGMQPSEFCAKQIKSNLDALARYTKDLSLSIRNVLFNRLNVSRGQSVRGAMTAWLQTLTPAQINHTYDASTTALLNVMRRDDNHTDAEWINMIAIALTTLPIEDWSDQHVETIADLLDRSISAIEAISEEEASISTSSASRIQLQLDGRMISQTLPDEELSGTSLVLYNSLKSDMNDFMDSLSPEEKLLVLAKVILHMND